MCREGGGGDHEERERVEGEKCEVGGSGFFPLFFACVCIVGENGERWAGGLKEALGLILLIYIILLSKSSLAFLQKISGP